MSYFTPDLGWVRRWLGSWLGRWLGRWLGGCLRVHALDAPDVQVPLVMLAPAAARHALVAPEVLMQFLCEFQGISLLHRPTRF